MNIAKTFNSKQFVYNPYTKNLVGGASELPGFLGTAFDDACDLGFNVISKITGQKVLFTLSETILDADGDVCSWKFLPIKNVGCAAVIFND